MSGYLTSLVQRARGEGAALQPRVRGRFEPAPLVEIVSERETLRNAATPALRSISAAAAAAAPDAAPSESSPQSPASPVEPERRPITATTEPPRPVADETTTLIEHATTRETESRVLERTALPVQTTRIERHTTTAAAEVREPAQTHPETDTRTHETMHTQTHSRSETRTHTRSHTERLAEESESEAPVVRITIGRIDVRAIAPPASRPPAPAPRRDGPLTLEDYLRRRDGEKR